jgi:tetratricopeptide (TPR) repeat protein
MNHPSRRIRFGAALCAAGILALALPGLAQYREYRISGQVVDSLKNPLAGVEIKLRDVSTRRSFSIKTGKDGSFKYVGLPHGVYQVSFRKAGFAEKTDEWKFEQPQESMLKVEIPPVVMVATEVIAQAEKLKEAAAGVKDAMEEVRAGRFDQGLALLKPILAANPDDTNALYVQGVAFQKKGQLPEAVASFLRVNELTPRFPAAFYQLGVCYQQMGEGDKALAAYAKALELDPANPDSAYNAGLVLFGRSQMPEALAMFEKALALRPDDPVYLEMAGRCYIHKADFPKAIELLEKARAGYAADPERVKFLDELLAKLREQIKK